MSLRSIHPEKHLFTVTIAQRTQVCWPQPKEAHLHVPGFIQCPQSWLWDEDTRGSKSHCEDVYGSSIRNSKKLKNSSIDSMEEKWPNTLRAGRMRAIKSCFQIISNDKGEKNNVTVSNMNKRSRSAGTQNQMGQYMAQKWPFSLGDRNILDLSFHFPFSMFSKCYNANISFHEKDAVMKKIQTKSSCSMTQVFDFKLFILR